MRNFLLKLFYESTARPYYGYYITGTIHYKKYLSTYFDSMYRTSKVFIEKQNNLHCAIFVEDAKWDSKYFGSKMGKIRCILVDDTNYNKKFIIEAATIRKILSESNFDYIFCRIHCSDMPSIHAIEENKFVNIGSLAIFVKTVSIKDEIVSLYPQKFSISFFEKKDINKISKIARKAFIYDRFHRDPLLSQKKASQVWVDSLINSCQDNSETVFVIKNYKKPAGFVVTRCEFTKSFLGADLIVIKLIAVTPEYQGKGMGSALIDKVIDFSRTQAGFIEVGTQLDNLQAIRLYQSKGFKLINSYLDYRWIRK